MIPLLAAAFFWIMPSVLGQLDAQTNSQTTAQPTNRVTMPPVTVNAQKEPADVQKLPVSVTAVSKNTLDNADITLVGDAAKYSPNTFFSEFSARKLSNARFRGVGSSPANPGVTTYIDGVPQLNANSSSIEFLDISQIEFVRGPQSSLFGRNALGGVINIESARPSSQKWTGMASVPIGSAHEREVRASVSGPLGNTVAISGAIGRSDRDGFTINDLTGHDLDSRSATFGKGQFAWTPKKNFEMRAIVTSERARDGDYALADLTQLRQSPFHVQRDFEGRTDRDVNATTVLTRYEGSRVSWNTTTGIVRWTTTDVTDLDYSPYPIATRTDDEKDWQWTEEVRFASAANAPMKLSNFAICRWQGGAFLFTQNYKQDAVNNFSPFVLSPFIAIPVGQHSPQSALDDFGLGIYGQGTLTMHEHLDVSAGVRIDHERKKAALNTFYSPAIFPPFSLNLDRSFSDVSPQIAVDYQWSPARFVYLTVARGFKAGGFNPASPVGSEAYSEERAWNLEGGVKSSWMAGRVTTNVSVFSINWDDLQLNVPNPQVPGQFYISNVGNATSRGVEIELNARPHAGVNLFATAGSTRARFGAGSVSSGVPVAGNEIPNTPKYTASFGAELSRALASRLTVYGRAEAILYGAFKYDDTNTAGQSAYSLADFRGGVRGHHLFGEAWVRNAFDTRYVPIAFAYPGLAPSGFIGENGKPRTFGVRIGVSF